MTNYRNKGSSLVQEGQPNFEGSFRLSLTCQNISVATQQTKEELMERILEALYKFCPQECGERCHCEIDIDRYVEKDDIERFVDK